MSAMTHTPRASEPPMLSGCMVVSADTCQYPPSVGPADLLRVNFDRRTVGPDGLYLLERIGPRGVEWRGCRRFVHELAGLMVDQSGRGDWIPAPSLSAVNLRIAGYVEQVYKPA